MRFGYHYDPQVDAGMLILHKQQTKVTQLVSDLRKLKREPSSIVGKSPSIIPESGPNPYRVRLPTRNITTLSNVRYSPAQLQAVAVIQDVYPEYEIDLLQIQRQVASVRYKPRSP